MIVRCVMNPDSRFWLPLHPEDVMRAVRQFLKAGGVRVDDPWQGYS